MKSRRVARTAVCVTTALSVVAAAASCSSFGSGPDATGDAGDEHVLDGAPDGAPDAAPRLDGSAIPLPCPPPTGGTKLPTSWTRRPLYSPTRRMYPFSIATDATHVAWSAQLGSEDGGLDTEPYNGIGEAIILRVRKDGTGSAVTVARNQPRARALTLDGDYIYWATYAQNVASLMRQSRDTDCDVACPAPTAVTTFPAGTIIQKLLRPGPGLIFALAEDGRTFRIALDTFPGEVAQAGIFPSIAMTATDVYTSGRLVARVQRIPISGAATDDTYLVPSPSDGGEVGVEPIGTDCTSLWMVRNASKPQLYRHDFATAGSFQAVTTFAVGVFELAADAKYVYAASPNGGGVWAVAKSSATSTLVYTGNVWTVATDDDGVYFGEHERAAGGGTMMMLVKE